MKKVIWSTAVMVFAAVLFCSEVKAQVFVNIQPVVPITINTRPQPPAPDYVWIDGHWLWHQPYNRYVWKDGYWAHPPRPAAVWVPGYWKTDVYCVDDRGPGNGHGHGRGHYKRSKGPRHYQHGYVWVPGRWR